MELGLELMNQFLVVVDDDDVTPVAALREDGTPWLREDGTPAYREGEA